MDLGEITRNLDGYAKKPFKRKYNEMRGSTMRRAYGSGDLK